MSFSHRDGYFTVTPLAGPNKGKPLRILAGTKVSMDPGGKAAYLKGFDQIPVAIVRQSAEPKLDVDLSSAAECWKVRLHVGGIGGWPFTVAHVFRRPGMTTQSFSYKACELENGGGYDSDDNGVSSKLSMKFTDCEHADGSSAPVSIYAKRAA
jgi:hypothetical protein